MAAPRTPQQEAVALGATTAEAQLVVQRLADADLLQHGVAVLAVVAAARAGVEPVDALRAMATGGALPQGMSAYELRVAAEEAESELGPAMEADGAPTAGTACPENS